MFEGLIVSSSVRRKKRTLRFFIATSLAYAVVVSGAMVISVIAARPELNMPDKNLVVLPMLPPKLGSPTASRHSQRSGGRQLDPYRPVDYDQLNTGPLSSASAFERPRPPQVGFDDDLSLGPGVRDGDPNGVPTLAERLPDHAPPPPEPERTPARPVQPEAQILKVPSSVLQGRAIARVTPDYPPIAKPIHLEGTVAIEIIISPDGRVESTRIVSGHPILAAAADRAARAWRFEPTKLNGVPVRATGVITFVFRLNQ
jgi:periplasmic protein TonB